MEEEEVVNKRTSSGVRHQQRVYGERDCAPVWSPGISEHGFKLHDFIIRQI